MPSRTVLAGLAAFAVLALLFASKDLGISQALVDENAGWARFGERYGSLPGAYAIAVAALFLHLRRPTAAVSLLVRLTRQVVYAAVIAGALVVSSRRLLDERLSLIASGGLFVLVFAALEASRGRGPVRALTPRAETVCRALLALGVSSWLCVYCLKLTWGRVRFRDLDSALTSFTPWYLPQGFTGHASFPSGHTAMGWALLPCLALWPRGSLPLKPATALVLGWGGFVAASRVVMGAHYASDVLFSTGICFGLARYALLRYGRPLSGAARD